MEGDGMTKKRVWVPLALVAVAGLIAAGVVFGPPIYWHFFPVVTPLGGITKVKAAGKKLSVEGMPAMRVWGVFFKPRAAPGHAGDKTKVLGRGDIEMGLFLERKNLHPYGFTIPYIGPDAFKEEWDLLRETYLLDNAGEKWPASTATGLFVIYEDPKRPGSESLGFQVELLGFLVWQERQPR